MKTSFFTFPILNTERLHLRGVTASDKGQIFKIRSDQKVNEYLDRPPARHIKEAELHILEIEQLYKDKQGITWVINRHDSRLFMGSICLWKYELEEASAEIGYYILPEYQRQGFMSEVMQACTLFAFDKMEVKSITADTHKSNIASIGLLEKFNFSMKKKCDWNPDHMQYRLRKKS